MDKFALVYEFNKESPLITYKASKELEAENYSKAEQMLASAIEKYPFHATSYFIYSLALANNKEFDKALEFLKKGHDLHKDNSTYDYYFDQIERIKREAEGINVNFDDTVNEVLNESFLEIEDFDTLSDLELLVNETLGLDQNSTTKDETLIVTETLAEIYASQNNFEEAIDIYEKLKDINPEKIDKFDIRISELKIAIENKKQKKFGI